MGYNDTFLCAQDQTTSRDESVAAMEPLSKKVEVMLPLPQKSQVGFQYRVCTLYACMHCNCIVCVVQKYFANPLFYGALRRLAVHAHAEELLLCDVLATSG